MGSFQSIFRYSLFTSQLCDCSVFLFVEHGIFNVFSLQSFGYVSDLYKGMRNFAQNVGISFSLHLLIAPVVCCYKKKPGVSQIPIHPSKHWLHSSQTFVLRNKPERTSSDDTSLFIGLLLCAHPWRGGCWKWNYTKPPATLSILLRGEVVCGQDSLPASEEAVPGLSSQCGASPMDTTGLYAEQTHRHKRCKDMGP